VRSIAISPNEETLLFSVAQIFKVSLTASGKEEDGIEKYTPEHLGHSYHQGAINGEEKSNRNTTV
jgi:hypothetical protein